MKEKLLQVFQPTQHLSFTHITCHIKRVLHGSDDDRHLSFFLLVTICPEKLNLLAEFMLAGWFRRAALRMDVHVFHDSTYKENCNFQVCTQDYQKIRLKQVIMRIKAGNQTKLHDEDLTFSCHFASNWFSGKTKS
jgi:hypothetical protein